MARVRDEDLDSLTDFIRRDLDNDDYDWRSVGNGKYDFYVVGRGRMSPDLSKKDLFEWMDAFHSGVISAINELR